MSSDIFTFWLLQRAFFWGEETLQRCISLHNIRVMHLSFHIIEGLCERIVEDKKNPRNKQKFCRLNFAQGSGRESKIFSTWIPNTFKLKQFREDQGVLENENAY